MSRLACRCPDRRECPSTRKTELAEGSSDLMERHFRGAPYNYSTHDHGDRGRAGVVPHAGSRLLADLADATTLTGELVVALDGVRGSRPRIAVQDAALPTAPRRRPVHPRTAPALATH